MAIDWSELNPELILLVSKKLGDITNFVCFRAVCKNWRFTTLPSDLPPQLPWYLEKYPETKDSSHLNFVSLCCNTTHKLIIPHLGWQHLYGSSNRYLLVSDSDDLSISLFNPITRSHFVVPIIDDDDFILYLSPIYIGPFENSSIAIIYRHGIDQKEHIVTHSVLFWRFGDKELTRTLKVPYAKSMSYYKGRLFVSVDDMLHTRVFDVATGEEGLIIYEPYRFNYLVEAFGDLLGVVQKSKRSKYERKVYADEVYAVYRLEEDGTDLKWVEITDGIRDRMLFLDEKVSLCLKASDFDGIRGNCIYLARWEFIGNCYGSFFTRHDLETKKTEVLPIPRGFHGTWFVPSLC